MKNKVLSLTKLFLLLMILLFVCVTGSIWSIITIGGTIAIYIVVNYKDKNKYVSGCCIFLLALVGYINFNTSFNCLFLKSSLVVTIVALLLMRSEKYIKKVYFELFFVPALFFFIFSPSHQIILSSIKPNSDVAYLTRGSWGVLKKETSNLTIQSQYSYDIIRRLIGSKDIEDLRTLENYNELWIVTPTIPFSKEEINKIRKWVALGGHLIVISDHTDLFGHATVLSPLLNSFGIKIGNDCIIERSGTCTYSTLFDSYTGLTSNTFKGNFISPYIVQLGFQESTNYGNESFFSDTQVTAEDDPNLFCIAARKGYGMGLVSIMGDSTIFANFALAWPSSQKILQDTLNPHKDIPYYLFIALFLLCLSIKLPLKINKKEFFLGVFIIIELCVLFTLPTRTFNLLETDIRNDTSSVFCERNGEYATLFASAFMCSRRFPISVGEVSQLNGFEASLENIPNPSFNRKQNQPLTTILSENMSVSITEYLAFLIHDSKKTSYWFDDGVGILKETAYKYFWDKINKTSETPKLSLGASIQIKSAICKERGRRAQEISYNYCNIEGTKEPWVIVGNYILGKLIGNQILIKKKWQDSYWQYDDMVLSLD